MKGAMMAATYEDKLRARERLVAELRAADVALERSMQAAIDAVEADRDDSMAVGDYGEVLSRLKGAISMLAGARILGRQMLPEEKRSAG